MNHLRYVFAVAVCLCGCAPDEGPTPTADDNLAPVVDITPFTAEAEQAAASIDADTLREVVAEIASDGYEGRGPGSAGDERTRAYLAQALERMGFAPAGPGRQWEQPFELVGIETAQPEQWTFSAESDVVLRQSEEFIVSSGVQSESARILDAELVFVGYGIQAPEHQWDDFKGVDLEGKVLLMLNNDPDWDAELFAGERRLYYGRWTYKYESAAHQGAAGAIIIHTTPSAGYPWQVVQSSWTGAQFELPATGDPRVQIAAWVTESAAEKLVALAGEELPALVAAARTREFRPVPLGIRTSITLANRLSQTTSANVLGILEGSDPGLRDEVVIYTAHHDHLGVGEPNPADPGDRIYNGARDNASGVAMVLAIGKAFAELQEPPRRSVMFAFVGAEEQGLLGSQYFAQQPTIAPGKIAAAVNLDGGNIWGSTRDVTFVGLGKSSLDNVARTVAAYQDRIVKPDQFPDRGFFYRSDQFSLAKIGVPAMYLDEGTEVVGQPAGWGAARIEEYTERDYHQPSDELTEDWSFAGMVQDAQFGFWAGLIVANADAMPAWNPGDEFEAARVEALEALE
jgi:Zn-dependent M28 family amino/carboxypeptidase